VVLKEVTYYCEICKTRKSQKKYEVYGTTFRMCYVCYTALKIVVEETLFECDNYPRLIRHMEKRLDKLEAEVRNGKNE